MSLGRRTAVELDSVLLSPVEQLTPQLTPNHPVIYLRTTSDEAKPQQDEEERLRPRPTRGSLVSFQAAQTQF